MEKNTDEILFITNTYPYGTGETFIENEINYLATFFKQVIIVPVNVSSEIKSINKRLSTLPSNVIVEEISEIDSFSFKKAASPILNELKHFKTGKKLANTANLRLFLGTLKKALKYVDSFENIIQSKGLSNSIVYSYWGEFWLVPILLLKEKYRLKVVGRFHRFDLYNEIHPNHYFALKPYMLRNLDGIYPISKMGVNYLLEEYGGFKEIKCFYLGIEPHDLRNKLNTQKGYTQIVSCAGMRKVKQIHKLIEALAEINVNVKWDHFGDGPLRSELEKQASFLMENIEYTFHGNLTNPEVHKFYQNNSVDIFINTSESEGIPVSIMEAISYGIPVIAPDVGGMPEIIDTNINGILLDDNFTNESLVEAINTVINLTETEILNIRESARIKWENNFNASINYPKFINRIKNL